MSQILYLFWSKNERRPRALWRLILHFGLWGIGTSMWILFFWTIATLTSNGNTPLWFEFVLPLSPLLSMVSVLYVMSRFIDNRPSMQDFGLEINQKWWTDFIFGLLLGVILMAGIFFAELLMGWVTIEATFFVDNSLPFPVSISLAAVLFVSVGIYEELLSRGYQMRNIAESLTFINPRAAVVLAWILSSAFFGVLHAGNPEATWVSTVNISLAGLLLGLPILLTGRIGASIGLHITWNFAQGNIFGFPVSGTSHTVSFIEIVQGGPDLWTGGAFGPEGGLIGLVAMLIGAFLILAWVRWQDQQIVIHKQYAEFTPIPDDE